MAEPGWHCWGLLVPPSPNLGHYHLPEVGAEAVEVVLVVVSALGTLVLGLQLLVAASVLVVAGGGAGGLV